MRKICLLFILTGFSTTFYGQSLLEKFDGQDEVSTVVVNKKMFELMGKIKVDTSDPATKDYLNLIKKLDELNVFSTQNQVVVEDMKTTADAYIQATNLTEFKKLTDAGRNISIYTNPPASNIQMKEVFMFVESPANEETVIVDLKGDFKLNEISLLIDKMKIPAGEYFKKTINSKM